MKVFLNYDSYLENHKQTIASLMKQKGLSAIATGRPLSISELLEYAKKSQCSAILLANEQTLNNCINSSFDVSLDKYRGSRLNFSIPTIVGGSLDYPRKFRYGRYVYERDLDKFKKIQTPVTQLRYTVCKSRAILDACYEIAKQAVIIAPDIETDVHNRITCVSFSCLLPSKKIVCFLIPFINFGTDYWDDPDDYAYAISIFRQISALDAAKLYFNGFYDSQYQICYHAEPNNYILDSMALAHAEYSELPKSLDFVASLKLYDYLFWKDEADDARKKQDIHAYWTYCARDSFNTLRCFLVQIQEAKSYVYENYRRQFKMVYPFIYCAFEGVKVDETVRQENHKKATEISQEALKGLRVCANDPDFNPGSYKQVQRLLFDIIGAIPVAKRKKKKDGTWTSNKSTDEKALAKISDQHPILAHICGKILEYREKVKAIGTYFEFNQWRGIDGQQPGRLLYSINPFGTDTGRPSSNASSFRLFDYSETQESKAIQSYGTQIQNIPAYAKNMLIADDGFELGEADNNKSEARCVGYLSGCIKLIQALEDITKDFYLVLGTIFFGLRYEDVSKELRNKVIKRVVHGKNYLMGAETFIETVGTKILYEGARLINYPIKTLKSFAIYLLSLYDKPFPEISTWYKEVKLEILRTNTLTSPLGWTRYFFGDVIKDHKVFRNAVAHGPQNLSVMILNKGLWKVYKTLVLTQHGLFRLKAHIHDSIFWQSPPEKRAEYDAKVKECMDNPVVIKGRTMRIPVDINHGKNWLELKS